MNNPDIRIEFKNNFQGYLFTPITKSGKKFCEKYKGVIMSKFSVPISKYEGVVDSILYRGLVIEYI